MLYAMSCTSACLKRELARGSTRSFSQYGQLATAPFALTVPSSRRAEFVRDSRRLRSRAPALRRTGMIRESYHDVTPRGEFLSRACASARMCPQAGSPEKAPLARPPSRSKVPWITLRLAWRLWPLSSTGETNWRSWSDSRSGSFGLTSHAILRLNGL
jgi:hypothetical protein